MNAPRERHDRWAERKKSEKPFSGETVMLRKPATIICDAARHSATAAIAAARPATAGNESPKPAAASAGDRSISSGFDRWLSV
jgi:hypothetical protein